MTRWLVISRSPLAYGAVVGKRNVAWSLKCAVLHDGKTAEQIDLRRTVQRQGQRRTHRRGDRGRRPVETKGHKKVESGKTADAAIALAHVHAIQGS